MVRKGYSNKSPMNLDRPKILVYHNTLLQISTTFIHNQSIHLRRYEARFIGCKSLRDGGIPLPEERLYILNSGGINGLFRETMFKLFGHIPADFLEWAYLQQPKLVHAHFASDGINAIPIAERLKLPLVVSFLGSDATINDTYMKRLNWSQRRYVDQKPILAKKATQFVVPSEYIKSRIIKQGFPEDKISVIHHGVNLNQFNSQSHSPEWGHIVYVGRLVPVKGLNYLIEALTLVKRKFPEAKLSIIGDGPMRKPYEQLARNRLGSGYTFLGSQPHNVVKEYLERAYLFCMPSSTMPDGQAEALGLVFIEAHAMGVPVASFASGGIPEVVKDGETGFLVPEKDVMALAKSIEVLLENPDQRQKMGEQARAHVEKLFDLEKQNAELESVYDEVINRTDAHAQQK